MSLYPGDIDQKPPLSTSDECNTTDCENELRGTYSLDDEDILPDMVLEEYRYQDGTTTTKLCKRCTSMASTLEGLTALTSEGGYVHYGLKKLEQSMKRGCKCCTMLAEDIEFLDYDRDEEAHSLILKADMLEDNALHTAGGSTYPLDDRWVGKLKLCRKARARSCRT